MNRDLRIMRKMIDRESLKNYKKREEKRGKRRKLLRFENLSQKLSLWDQGLHLHPRILPQGVLECLQELGE